MKFNRMCDICGERKSEVRVVQYVGGRRKELLLCRKCASTAGIDEQLGDEKIFLESNFEPTHSCPQCGWRLQDIIDTGMLGCPGCFDEFYNEVKPLIKHFHGDECLKGRTRLNRQIKISTLQWQLRKAVDEERFEDAAKIRDLIQKIEQGKNIKD